MPFLVYFTVLLIAGGSVLFGLDWLSSPMSPMPPIKPVPVQVAKAPPTPAQVPVRTVNASSPVPVAVPSAPPAAAARAETAPPVAAEPAPPVETNASDTAVPQIVADEKIDEKIDEKPQAKCDVDACSAAYRSFTASDCTYQPNFGPRRLCTKGVAVSEPADPSTAARAEANGRVPAQCNVNACSSAYISFSAADCTYQPTDGPRRLCTK